MSVAQDYYVASRCLRASEIQELAVASCVPQMSKEERKKYFKELNKKIQSVIDQDNKAVLSIEDAAKILARKMMNG